MEDKESGRYDKWWPKLKMTRAKKEGSGAPIISRGERDVWHSNIWSILGQMSFDIFKVAPMT